MNITEASHGLREKKFSSEELTRAHFDRIKKIDKDLNSFVLVTEKKALEQAKKVDAQRAAGEELGPLAGIPVGIKDIINTKGIRTTCCSNILREFVPPYNATVIEKLEDAGYVLLGKLNTDEFACGVSTEHSCFGVTKNPWDLTRVAGGSSGGPAAAVAADLAMYSLGTDTGGSIRMPASVCGIVGLKVTYGRVSRSGVTALASSWDTVGPFARSVEDIALVMNAIAGRDPKDSTTPSVEVPDYTLAVDSARKNGIKGLKIGIPKEFFGEGIEPEVADLVRNAVKELEKQGAHVEEVSIPMTKYGVALYYIAMPAELSANLARYDGIRFGSKPKGDVKDLYDYYATVRTEGFGDEIKRRIMIGTYVLSSGYYDAYYRKAQQVRTLLIRDFAEAFKKVDVLAGPVSPFPAFEIGGMVNDPMAMYLADILTIPANAAGIPGLSVPCGFTKKGLPVGMQILGPQFTEALLLRVGYAYEQYTDWHAKRPVL